ncbi:MAG: disulfide bond formation protein B [Gammaproteobacteria bacterium]|nr:disulfide bond formation protein B [Gammaproteobacteria bacterium]
MSEYIPSTRNLNWIIGFGCMFLIGVALYMEHMMHLEPCPLCIFQRVAVITAGLIAIVAALHNPQRVGIKVYSLMVVMASTIGGALAIRQLHLQSLPEDQVPTCGPGLDYLLDVFPMQDVIQMVLVGDGSCAEVAWSLLGISIPGWALVGFIGLVTLGLFQAFRDSEHQ